MNKSIAVTMLTIIFALNISSGDTPKIDRGMFKIESSLCDKLEDQARAERVLEEERRFKSRVQISCKV
jgi:hypothetical protein